MKMRVNLAVLNSRTTAAQQLTNPLRAKTQNNQNKENLRQSEKQTQQDREKISTKNIIIILTLGGGTQTTENRDPPL